MAGWAPGIVFEVVIGMWLLLKGIRLVPATVAAAETAPQAAAGQANR
jgi:hypothetical protein